MSRRVSRTGWLAVFASLNLVLWTAVAVAIAVIASERVNLGIESTVRQVQATAVASWRQISNAPARTEANPAGAAAASPVATADGTAVAAGTAVSQPARPATREPAVAAATAAAGQGSTTGQSTASTSQAAAAPLSAPLVLADPQFSSLGQLEPELRLSSPGRAVEIRYAEGPLNGEIGASLAANPDVPYRNLQVDLRPDQVALAADLTVLGFAVRAEVQGTLAAADCRPQATVGSVTVAGVSAPGFVRDYVLGILEQAMNWYPAGYPLCLERVAVEDGRVTLYGHSR